MKPAGKDAKSMGLVCSAVPFNSNFWLDDIPFMRLSS
jgi:hypothetical protein